MLLEDTWAHDEEKATTVHLEGLWKVFFFFFFHLQTTALNQVVLGSGRHLIYFLFYTFGIMENFMEKSRFIGKSNWTFLYFKSGLWHYSQGSSSQLQVKCGWTQKSRLPYPLLLKEYLACDFEIQHFFFTFGTTLQESR